MRPTYYRFYFKDSVYETRGLKGYDTARIEAVYFTTISGGGMPEVLRVQCNYGRGWKDLENEKVEV